MNKYLYLSGLLDYRGYFNPNYNRKAPCLVMYVRNNKLMRWLADTFDTTIYNVMVRNTYPSYKVIFGPEETFTILRNAIPYSQTRQQQMLSFLAIVADYLGEDNPTIPPYPPPVFVAFPYLAAIVDNNCYLSLIETTERKNLSLLPYRVDIKFCSTSETLINNIVNIYPGFGSCVINNVYQCYSYRTPVTMKLLTDVYPHLKIRNAEVELLINLFNLTAKNIEHLYSTYKTTVEQLKLLNCFSSYYR